MRRDIGFYRGGHLTRSAKSGGNGACDRVARRRRCNICNIGGIVQGRIHLRFSCIAHATLHKWRNAPLG
jgi:hypothetical protein